MPLFDRFGKTLAEAARLTSLLVTDPRSRTAPEPPPEPTPANTLTGPAGPSEADRLVKKRAEQRAKALARAEGKTVEPAARAKAKAPEKPEARPKKPKAEPKKAKAEPKKPKVEPKKPKVEPKKAKRAKRPKARRPKPALPETLHRQVLDALHHAVMVVSVDREVVYANRAMCRYVGLVTGRDWTPSELEGMDVMAFHPPPSVAGTERRFEAMSGDGDLAPRTDPVDELMFLTWDSRILDEQGQIVAWVLERIPAGFAPSPPD